MDEALSHLDEHGAARMVDVSAKADTKRRAVAACKVFLSEKTMKLLKDRALPKGDVLSVAKIAGIMAAKKTPQLIPLCHPISLTYADVILTIDEIKNTINVEACAESVGPTGVEMEAITAALIAALTIYDMCKAVQKDIVISECRLTHKSGGRSGVYQAL